MTQRAWPRQAMPRHGEFFRCISTGDIILKGKGSRITTADGQLKVVTNNGYLKLDQNFNASGQGTNTVLSIPEKKSAPKKK